MAEKNQFRITCTSIITVYTLKVHSAVKICLWIVLCTGVDNGKYLKLRRYLLVIWWPISNALYLWFRDCSIFITLFTTVIQIATSRCRDMMSGKWLSHSKRRILQLISEINKTLKFIYLINLSWFMTDHISRINARF